MHKNCLNCGKLFQVKHDRKKFCNSQCFRDYLKINRKGKYIKCKVCRKEFYIMPGDVGRKFYCSRKCYFKDKDRPQCMTITRIARKCKFCGTEFFVIPSNTKKFCSQKCFRKYVKVEGQGELLKQHTKEIKRQVKNLTEQGFKCFVPGPIPDIIANKNGKNYAVEVDLTSYPNTDKYNDIDFFDDVYWIKVASKRRRRK